MRVLAFSAYYTPEVAASLYLTEDIYEGMANSGHTIDLYVPVPCRGVNSSVRDKYKKKKNEVKYKGRLRIHRFAMYKEGKNPLLRALRYFLLTIAFIWKGLFTKADVIFVQSTPPIQGMMAGILKIFKRIPVVYNLQDIFPDSLVNAGMTRQGSLIWKIGRLVEIFTYHQADKIIVISEDFKKNLLKKGVKKDKIEVVYNWVDIEKITPVKRNENPLFDEYGIDRSKFIVVYAGNFGASQGAEIIIDVARQLQNERDIEFIVFGSGSEFEKVKKEAEGIDNIKIFGLLPAERVSEVYSMGDVALVTCKKGIGKSGMPSKTWNIMACNTPILASFDTDSELAEIITKSGAGICVEPENAEKLAEAVRWFKRDENYHKFKTGREYIAANVSKSGCVTKYIDIVQRVV